MSADAGDYCAYDVFISYWHDDREWVKVLAENLERLGVRVWWDGWEIIAGDVVNLRIEDGLTKSRCGVVVCSDGTAVRPFVAEEYAGLLNKAVLGEGRLIPVIYRLMGQRPSQVGLGVRLWVDFREVDAAGYEARVKELADAIRGARPERPREGEPLVVPPDAREREWDARAAMTRALMREGANAIVDRLDVRLGGAPAPTKSSTLARAELVAGKIDGLGSGAGAALKLVEACYQALSAMTSAEREGARRVLRPLLSEWLEYRFGRGISAASRSRSNEDDAVEDLRLGTRHHEIAAPRIAQADRRAQRTPAERAPDLYETREAGGATRVVPVGSMPPPAKGFEIETLDETVDAIADGMASQIPSEPGVTREDRQENARDWFALFREPGMAYDPRHMAIPTAGLDAQACADLDAVLVLLKARYPALRLVELGGEASAEERKIRTKILEIFKDEGG